MNSYVLAQNKRERLRGTYLMSGFGLLWTIYPLSSSNSPIRSLAFILLLLGLVGTSLAFYQFRRAKPPIIPNRQSNPKQAKHFRLVGVTQAAGIFAVVVLASYFKHPEIIPCLTILIVGLHFLPLAKIFEVTQYFVTASGLIVIAIVGLYFSIESNYSSAPGQLAALATSAVLYLTTLSLVSKNKLNTHA